VSRIRRRDRKQVAFTGARVRGNPQAISEIKAQLDEEFFPGWKLRHPNVEQIVVGDDEVQTTFFREMIVSLIAILFMMYGLLAIAFKSYAQPLLIMIAIPFAFIGMIFGNLITDVPFGVMSVFGFFAASGVAVNDNLVLIDYVNRLRDKGVGAYQAMLDACVARFRPILLTSVTTFIGITPILFETSTQAQFLKPMVVALAFGVLFDFFLTLMLVPAMYGIGVDINRFFKGLNQESDMTLKTVMGASFAVIALTLVSCNNSSGEATSKTTKAVKEAASNTVKSVEVNSKPMKLLPKVKTQALMKNALVISIMLI